MSLICCKQIQIKKTTVIQTKSGTSNSNVKTICIAGMTNNTKYMSYNNNNKQL